MAETFKSLGFTIPRVATNFCGIKVYFGHKGENDWGVQIPNRLLPKEYRDIDKNPLDYYLISESEALGIAEKFTKTAKENDNG